jgi:hypothetical protein
MMSAESMRPALPVTTPRIRGETLAGTKSQVDLSEAEPIRRALGGQEEVFRELERSCEHSWLLKLF